ncbi:MAG: hypothetical protein HUJ77_10405 [Clostridium sp.]|uniref:hypothetical protein n=1 Tax=Clostridium sp. TaxID=1506 RepID=UPI0025C12901|nr:hypothetical protein [Clostridium sp.]MCF0148791.1 hypothetical protein [Clostridium sp.]
MDGGKIVFALGMTVIFFLAIKLATPIKRGNKSGKILTKNKEVELVKLRDIEVLSNDEFKEVLKLYHNKNLIKEEYEKYENLLNELKDIRYFYYEEYASKINKLKKYFKVN